ncbi:hypothetical protein UCRPC4_g04805 [Phaeomoniella chlamydospora]|uniref:Uncharacterized protein n=1 Tax=Phaeomoniella chlamydospora TaxID=158046 RepID=A0A0G2E7Z6_PHACM|nr:hypothetical protein UCRPC4_g04805 [Phaeomoniella chlamydospora]
MTESALESQPSNEELDDISELAAEGRLSEPKEHLGTIQDYIKQWTVRQLVSQRPDYNLGLFVVPGTKVEDVWQLLSDRPRLLTEQQITQKLQLLRELEVKVANCVSKVGVHRTYKSKASETINDASPFASTPTAEISTVPLRPLQKRRPSLPEIRNKKSAKEADLIGSPSHSDISNTVSVDNHKDLKDVIMPTIEESPFKDTATEPRSGATAALLADSEDKENETVGEQTEIQNGRPGFTRREELTQTWLARTKLQGMHSQKEATAEKLQEENNRIPKRSRSDYETGDNDNDVIQVKPPVAKHPRHNEPFVTTQRSLRPPLAAPQVAQIEVPLANFGSTVPIPVDNSSNHVNTTTTEKSLEEHIQFLSTENVALKTQITRMEGERTFYRDGYHGLQNKMKQISSLYRVMGTFLDADQEIR